MKILTNGKVFQFVCEVCGCEFVEGINRTENLGFYIRAYCPECGCECRAHTDKEEENG